jgi:glycosyltransferase involved in cell wall biosynthesis
LKNKHLHIVAFDVPFPADYGGVYAIFYKIKALYEKGIKIHLHCFDYGRGPQKALALYCASVHYYERAEGTKGFSFTIPYIVASRNNAKLWERLQKDNYPVLLEGVHCTYGIHAGLLPNRKVIVYLHNVEHEYYQQLSRWERSLVKKTYFHHESRLLERYERQLAAHSTIVALSEKDKKTYKSKLGAPHISFLPVFTENSKVQSLVGNGNYALYHGNLSVAENEKAAFWLLEKIFNDLDIPLVIAGKNPSDRLIKATHQRNTRCMIANPDEHEMNDLIAKAHLNILPSFTDCGLKLKLINALYKGRHVVVNEAMVSGTGLEQACIQADSAAVMKYQIYRLFQLPFTEEDQLRRQEILSNVFNQEAQVNTLISLLFG